MCPSDIKFIKMRLLFTLLFVLLFPNASFTQIPIIIIKQQIDFNSNQIKETVSLTNYKIHKSGIWFALHDSLKVEKISINNKKCNWDFTGNGNSVTTFYSIKSDSNIINSDTIHFEISGSFKSFDSINKNTKTSESIDICKNYNILRISGAWYPVIIPLKSNPDSLLNPLLFHKKHFKVNVSCNKGYNIQIGNLFPKPDSSSTDRVCSNLAIIAGDYHYTNYDNICLINFDDTTELRLQSRTKSVIQYYEHLLNVDYGSNPILVNINHDIAEEGGFCMFPVMVFTNNGKASIYEVELTLCHEIGHYYFGNYFEPPINPILFYLESINEYFTYKYCLTHGIKNHIANKYSMLKVLKALHFIPFLNKIQGVNFRFSKLSDKKSTISMLHAYNYGPFQLLAIERRIGEDSTMLWIKKCFETTLNNKDGYNVMIQSFKEIGINPRIIIAIEKKIFKKFKIREYYFINDLLKAS